MISSTWWSLLLKSWSILAVCRAVLSTPTHPTLLTIRSHHRRNSNSASCFPALGFNPPWGVPTQNVTNWWCSPTTEQGFLGFSYDVGACQSKSQLLNDFQQMRDQFNARYVRLYSPCDNHGFIDDVISSAYSAGIGVYALIWFGFNGGNEWKSRRDTLIETVQKNELAKYVIRSVDVGSEPLFDEVLTPEQLANQVNYVKSKMSPYGIQVSISEMQYGYERQGNSKVVLDAEQMVHAHELPFFDSDATTGSNAWPSIRTSLSWFLKNTNYTKKVIFTQTGWPTNTHVWKANSPNAVASLESSKQFADLLDSKCEEMKSLAPLGGVGWFWQIWSDEALDGWGIIDWNGNPKWNFAPRTAC